MCLLLQYKIQIKETYISESNYLAVELFNRKIYRPEREKIGEFFVLETSSDHVGSWSPSTLASWCVYV